MNIKKVMLTIAFVLTVLYLNAQDIRDKYIGTYSCKIINCSKNQLGQYDCDTSLSKLRFEKATEASKLQVYIGDEQSYILLTKKNDSTFTNTDFHYRGAVFYKSDSVSFSIVHSSIGYSKYLGKKNNGTPVYNVGIALINAIFPNPFDDFININFVTDNTYFIKLYDSKGNLIFHETITDSVFKKPTSQLNSGIYLLEIISNNLTQTIKLIKK